MIRTGNESIQGVVCRLSAHVQREGLTVGDRLPSIRRLARILDVGPHVVRDALLQAQSLGLVSIQPRSGAFVRSLDFSPLVDTLPGDRETTLGQADPNLFHLLEARRLIEAHLVGEAAARRRPEDLLPLRQALQAMAECGEDRAAFIAADERFHLGIARIAGNGVLLVMLRTLLAQLRPYRMGQVLTEGRRQSNAYRHEEIYRCLLDGDVEEARAAMLEHGTIHHQVEKVALDRDLWLTPETAIPAVGQTGP